MDQNFDKDRYYLLENGRYFDLESLLYKVSVYRDPIYGERRKRVAEALVSALRDLSIDIPDQDRKMEILKRGIIKFKYMYQQSIYSNEDRK